jgi:hypothetical protein
MKQPRTDSCTSEQAGSGGKCHSLIDSGVVTKGHQAQFNLARRFWFLDSRKNSGIWQALVCEILGTLLAYDRKVFWLQGLWSIPI